VDIIAGIAALAAVTKGLPLEKKSLNVF